MMKNLEGQLEGLTRKNHELEWTVISLCRRAAFLVENSANREERRHVPYLRNRGNGKVFGRQVAVRSSGPPKGPRRKTVDSLSDLSDYVSDA